jgi:hypothetical protein
MLLGKLEFSIVEKSHIPLRKVAILKIRRTRAELEMMMEIKEIIGDEKTKKKMRKLESINMRIIMRIM